jgi:hypothetical protein
VAEGERGGEGGEGGEGREGEGVGKFCHLTRWQPGNCVKCTHLVPKSLESARRPFPSCSRCSGSCSGLLASQVPQMWM